MPYKDIGSCNKCKSGRLRSSLTSPYCKPCGAEYNKQARQRRKEKVGTTMHPAELKKRLGCTVEEYTERMATSDVCECCGKTGNLVYDHCHDSMEFRGVLCSNCNRGLGYLGDTLESAKAAVRYLEKHYGNT